MPMFGSSKKHDNDNGVSDIMDNTTGGGRRHAAHPTNQAALNDYPAQAPGGGMGNANNSGQTHPASGPGANYDNNNFQSGPGQHGQQTGFAQDDPYSAGGVGHQGDGRGGGIPPTGALDHGTGSNQSGSSGGHGAGGRLAGKIETAIGTIVGSDALKAKGLQKEHEANSIKLQGRELAEAERLEREAMMRRERAVAHGADPANSALGAGNPGVGNTGVGTGHGPGLL